VADVDGFCRIVTLLRNNEYKRKILQNRLYITDIHALGNRTVNSNIHLDFPEADRPCEHDFKEQHAAAAAAAAWLHDMCTYTTWQAEESIDTNKTRDQATTSSQRARQEQYVGVLKVRLR
jgi:hypothetical protein